MARSGNAWVVMIAASVYGVALALAVGVAALGFHGLALVHHERRARQWPALEDAAFEDARDAFLQALHLHLNARVLHRELKVAEAALAAETTDENPDRVAVIQRLSTAYLRTALQVDDTSWPAARAAFKRDRSREGVENVAGRADVGYVASITHVQAQRRIHADGADVKRGITRAGIESERFDQRSEADRRAAGSLDGVGYEGIGLAGRVVRVVNDE